MSSLQKDKLKQKVKGIPAAPGVYLMKNARGKVIYVGKAKQLDNRVKSYFGRQDALDVKTQALVRSIDSIDYIATDSELEALVLENTLIKEYRPRYNIRLKDDKRYPYIKLTVNEAFPRLLVVRKLERDGAEYFGPYTDAGAVRSTLKLLGSIFPLRNCLGKTFSTEKDRVCLNFHIGRCLGPCTGKVSGKEYGEIVKQVRLFLKGRNEELFRILKEFMRSLAGEKRYEEAAVVRDQLRSCMKVAQRQLAVSPGGRDEDVIAVAREGNRSCGVVLRIREGKILGSETFMIPADTGVDDKALFDAFFGLYYHSAMDIPPHIITQFDPTDRELLMEWLEARTGGRVRIVTPKRGEKKKLLDMALRNATLKILSGLSTKRRSASLLLEVKEKLGLPVTPFRIEAFDISTVQGAESVGSMVTFVNAVPLKTGYRHFRIADTGGMDDFAMIEEVLVRRLSHLKEGHERHPDLILIDGGKGQLTAAMKGMKRASVAGIPLIGLAKRNEELFLTGRKDPLRLPRRSETLKLFQRIRDEAHRFAVTYHRKRMSKRLERSELDDIPGIGTKRKITLLVEFGSIAALRRANVEEIAAVEGIGGILAAKIHAYLHGVRER